MEDPTSTTERTVHLIAGPIGELSWEKFRTESLCPPFKERVLTSTEFEMITQAYKLLYPHTSKIDVNRIVVSSDRAHCGTITFSTTKVSNSSTVMALWGNPALRLYYGQIKYIIQSNVQLTFQDSTCQNKTHLLAQVDWFKFHPLKSELVFPWTLCFNEYEQLQPISFIPLSRISSRGARTDYVISEKVNRDYANHVVVAVAPVDFICAEFILKHLVK